MIAELRESFPTAILCRVFDVKRSSFYEWLQRLSRPKIEREELKGKVVELHSESREAMGSRTISKHLKAQNIAVGRSLVRTLMREAKMSVNNASLTHSGPKELKHLSHPICSSVISSRPWSIRSGVATLQA